MLNWKDFAKTLGRNRPQESCPPQQCREDGASLWAEAGERASLGSGWNTGRNRFPWPINLPPELSILMPGSGLQLLAGTCCSSPGKRSKREEEMEKRKKKKKASQHTTQSWASSTGHCHVLGAHGPTGWQPGLPGLP